VHGWAGGGGWLRWLQRHLCCRQQRDFSIDVHYLHTDKSSVAFRCVCLILSADVVNACTLLRAESKRE